MELPRGPRSEEGIEPRKRQDGHPPGTPQRVRISLLYAPKKYATTSRANVNKEGSTGKKRGEHSAERMRNHLDARERKEGHKTPPTRSSRFPFVCLSVLRAFFGVKVERSRLVERKNVPAGPVAAQPSMSGTNTNLSLCLLWSEKKDRMLPVVQTTHAGRLCPFLGEKVKNADHRDRFGNLEQKHSYTQRPYLVPQRRVA